MHICKYNNAMSVYNIRCNLNAKRKMFARLIYKYCINLKYNIYGNYTDGFKLVLENYLNGNEYSVLFEIRGPLYTNKWYNEYIQAKNIAFNQFRVFRNIF